MDSFCVIPCSHLIQEAIHQALCDTSTAFDKLLDTETKVHKALVNAWRILDIPHYKTKMEGW